MFIYHGIFTFNLSQPSLAATSELMTLVFPSGVALNDPVSAYWQWTTGSTDKTVAQSTVITGVSKTREYIVDFTITTGGIDLPFKVTIPPDSKSSINVNIKDINFKLGHMYDDASLIPSTVVYTGTLNWKDYTKQEMFTVVIPDGIASGKPFGLYYRLERYDSSKESRAVNNVFNKVLEVDGVTTAEYTDNREDGKWVYTFTFGGPGKSSFKVDHRNVSENPMVQHDFRSLGTKKALIVRWNTGTDNGIFDVQKMLIDHLGFHADDITMLYDLKSATLSPTAENFKNLFHDFIGNAKAGEVRFLYMDAHDNMFPPKSEGRGWLLASASNHELPELVEAHWFQDQIEKYLSTKVSFTILTSSYGGAQLSLLDGPRDQKDPIAGIYLSGCTEQQFNIKALKNSLGDGLRDPWMSAIVAVIKYRVEKKREVPTYNILFSEAKILIQRWLNQNILNLPYKGFSPDDIHPIPAEYDWNSSHQDPQMVFDSGYINPGTERFLFQFAAGGTRHSHIARYPRDEVPQPHA